jgi:hypothetical protein
VIHSRLDNAYKRYLVSSRLPTSLSNWLIDVWPGKGHRQRHLESCSVAACMCSAPPADDTPPAVYNRAGHGTKRSRCLEELAGTLYGTNYPSSLFTLSALLSQCSWQGGRGILPIKASHVKEASGIHNHGKDHSPSYAQSQPRAQSIQMPSTYILVLVVGQI